MKITAVRTFHVQPRWLLVALDTDRGVTGWGEPVVEGQARVVERMIQDLAEYLAGQGLGTLVHNLLGGAVRDRVRMYGHACGTRTADFVERAEADGSLLAVLQLPVSHPTSRCFGGEDLDLLLVTTGRTDQGPEHEHPWAGRLLQIRTGVTGLPTTPMTLP